MSVKVLITDDHQLVREGLRSLLGREPWITVVGMAQNGKEALRLARELEPDVILIDVAMPDLNGVETTRRLRREAPGTKVIALSMHCDRRYVTAMFEAGASGYLPKDSAVDELTLAIRAVTEGSFYLSPRITGVVLDDYLRRLGAGAPSSPLSEREREVLQLVAEGRSTKDIADRLTVSAKTVETHRQNLMRKLNLHSVAELTKYALREGLTTLDF